MRKLWSLLFLCVPIFCVVCFVLAPFPRFSGVFGWLPENISSFGKDVDHLFMVILLITSVTFLATQAVLFFALFRYAETGRRAPFIHTHRGLEIAWTIVPAGILVFIAFYQFNTWLKMKGRENFPEPDVVVEALAGQFEWRIRYPGLDGKPGVAGVDDDGQGGVDDWGELLYPGSDDVEVVNDLQVPVQENIVVRLRSRDVLHSFFLPHLRVKQDAVPGMTIPVWFQATSEGKYDLVCAELCGWGHYKMRGRLVVHRSRADFEEWLRDKYREQEKFRDSAVALAKREESE